MASNLIPFKKLQQLETSNKKKLPFFTTIIIFSILIFNGSCSKDTKSPDPGQTTTGNSKIVYADLNPDSVIAGQTK
jgi:hypothetical protein